MHRTRNRGTVGFGLCPATSGGCGAIQRSALYFSNATIEGLTAIGLEPALQLQFNAQWSQMGVKLTTPQNWSAYTGFSVRLQNLENRVVSFGIMFDRNAAWTHNSRVTLTLRANETRVFYVDFSGINPMTYGFRSPLPGLTGAYSHQTPGDRPGPISSVFRCHLYNRFVEPARIRVSSIYGIQANNSFVDLVDSMGQLQRKLWRWKYIKQGDFAAQLTDENSDLALNPGTGETLGATTIAPTAHRGSWILFKTSGEKWYFLSPEGRYFWSLGVCQVGGLADTIVEGRETMFSNLPAIGSPKAQFYGTTVSGSPRRTYSHYGANLYEKFGATWPTERFTNAKRRMNSWGFNTLGSGSDIGQLALNPVPFTFTLMTTAYPTRLTTAIADGRTLPDAYGSDFVTWMQTNFRESIQYWLDHPMLIGAYVDGEKPWGVRNGSLREQYQIPLGALRAPAAQPAKTVFVDQLVAKYRSMTKLNSAWGTSYTSWNALRSSTADLSDTQIVAARPDFSKCLYEFSKLYTYGVRTALTSLKSGFIYLGGRENLGTTPEEAVSGVLNHADIFSITHYDDAADVPWDYLASLSRPVLISEFPSVAKRVTPYPKSYFRRLNATPRLSGL